MDLMMVNEYLRYAAFAVMLLRLIVVVGYGRQGSLWWTFVLPHGATMLLVFRLAAMGGGWTDLTANDPVATATWVAVIIGQGAAVIAGWWPTGLSAAEKVVVRGEAAADRGEAAAERTEQAAGRSEVASDDTRHSAQRTEVAAESMIERMDRNDA